MIMKNKGIINIGLIIVGLIVAYALLQNNGLQGFQWQQSYGQPYVVLQQITETPNYFVSISITPNNPCIGEQITGTITSNIPFGKCSAYVDNKFMTNADLDASGSFSYSNSIGVIGSATVKVICCDSQNRCKTSNEVVLTVRNCGITTTISQGKYYCCFAMGQFACFQNACPPAGQQIGQYDTILQCNANCNKPITTAQTTTTTVSSSVYCTASYPIPRSSKDCVARIGCGKLQYCTYIYDLRQGSRCECKDKYGDFTTTKTTVVTTIPTCANLCPVNCEVKSTYTGTSEQCCRDIKSWCYGHAYTCELKTSGSLTCCCGECDYNTHIPT